MTRPQRRAAIVGVALVTLLALYAAAGYLVVPRVLESRVRSIVAEELSLEASFERVAFDPFAMRLEVDGFAMGRPGEDPVAALETLRVDVEALRLPATRVVLSELVLGRPELTLVVSEDGEVELAGVPLGGDEAEEPAAAEEQDADDGGSPLAELRVESLAIRNGSFHVRDLSREPDLARDLEPIDLQARGLDLTDLLGESSAIERSEAELVFGLGDGAALTARGGLDVDPMALDLELALVGVRLEALQPYVASFADLEVRSGALEASGSLVLGADSPIDFRGEAHLADLRLDLAGADRPSLAWKRLVVQGIEVGGDPLAVRIGSVALAEPLVRLAREDGGLDLANAFAREDAEREEPEPADAEAAAEPPAVAVGPIRITNGLVRFEDRTIRPAYGVELEKLAVDVDGFRTDPKSRSQARVGAEVDGYAPVRLEGTLAPLAPRDFLDMQLVLEGLELESFSAYTGRYLGRKIDGGRGSVDVAMKVVDQRMDSRTRITLDGLAFGARVESEDATSLPVASAASLAKDADGRIFFDIPVEGNLEDPGFRYFGALRDALSALVMRIVSAPYKVVGGMISFGGELFTPEEMSEVGFGPGSAELAGAQQAKVDAIAAALVETPGLTLRIRGGAAPKLDGESNLGALARKRARAVRQRIEAAGVAAERLEEREVEIDDDRASEDEQVVTRVELR